LPAGRREKAESLLHTLEAFANDGEMIPEQVWDSTDISQRELFFGRPSGSAMPLVWAHAEYIKLRRSLQDGRVFDMPLQTVQRYLGKKVDSPYTAWRFNLKVRYISQGKKLRIETLSPAIIRWSCDEWKTSHDTSTHDTSLGLHVADLPTADLPPREKLLFTFFWPQANRWEGVDFTVEVK
jgi:glucoamylase